MRNVWVVRHVADSWMKLRGSHAGVNGGASAAAPPSMTDQKMQLLRMAHLNRLAYQRGSSAAGWSGRGGSAEGTSKQHETRSARESSLGTSTGPGTVFMDFDGTLTRDDTCAEFSVMGHPEPGPQRHGNQLLWSRLVREYDEARDAFMARHVPQGRASRFDPGCLKWFLKELSTFEG